MKSKRFFLIFSLFMVLLCCFSAVSASEDVDDSVMLSDDGAVDEVVSEIDSCDEAISVENDEQLESVDDSCNESVADQEKEQVADDVLAAEENDNSVSGQTPYNAVANPIMGKSIDNAILGVSMEDIVGAYSGVGSIIYVNCSSENQPDGLSIFGKTWEDAFGTSEGLTFIFQNDLLQNKKHTIILADGEYCYEDNPESVNLAWVSIIFEGYGKNVVFKFDNGYNIDNGAEWEYAETDEDIKSKSEIYTIYKNIIFDCPVTVGSQTNTFTNCVFKDDVKISNICGNSLWSISFDNCTFLKNSKDEIQIPDGIEVTFADNCTFPTLSVNTTLDVSSPEIGVVVISLVDNSGAPVAGATISYIINGEAKENTTDANGQIKIQLTGEGKITNITYIGNETYKASNNTDFEYNFTEPKTQQNTTSISNGTNTNPGKTNTQTTTPTKKATKKATKITAKKATFKAKKKTKKYTIVLKAGKTAVKKVKVTIKVGKKTYTAKTNTKGKATFNLKKLTKKGKYTAVIKFKGNKNYNATTKKVKITVKK